MIEIHTAGYIYTVSIHKRVTTRVAAEVAKQRSTWGLTEMSLQNWITAAAADISAHTVIAQLYHWFQPTANPSASSTKREQNLGVAPGSGIQVVISPRHRI